MLLAGGVVLWALTWFLNRALYARPTRIKDPSHMATGHDEDIR